MGLKIYLDHGDGKEFELLRDITDRRITRVSLNGSTGEAGALNVRPDQNEVVLRYEFVAQDGRPTLEDLESAQNRTLTGEEAAERQQMLDELPTASNQGVDPLFEASKRRADAQAEQDRVEEVRAQNEVERQEQLSQVQGAPVNETSSEDEGEVDPSGDDGGSGHSGDAETGSTANFDIGLGNQAPDSPAGASEPDVPVGEGEPSEADLAAQRLKESEA